VPVEIGRSVCGGTLRDARRKRVIDALEMPPEQPLDVHQVLALFGVAHRQRDAGRTPTRGATDAMHGCTYVSGTLGRSKLITWLTASMLRARGDAEHVAHVHRRSARCSTSTECSRSTARLDCRPTLARPSARTPSTVRGSTLDVDAARRARRRTRTHACVLERRVAAA
jgi:hypothetical protein